MNAALLAAIAFVAFALGYRYYARFLGRVIFKLSADERVPSRELEDGVDFVPTQKHVLWGHHFTSIAGAAPIIGPAIAAQHVVHPRDTVDRRGHRFYSDRVMKQER